MSVSNTVVKQMYNGNGSTTNFTIPFAYIGDEASAQVTVYKVDNVTGVQTLQVEGALQDYTLTPVYNAVTNPNGPTTVVFNTAPANTVKVLIIRTVPLTQVIDFIVNTSSFKAEDVEEGMDRIVMMVQQLAEVLSRVPAITQFQSMVGLFNPNLPVGEADQILTVNATGDGFIWVDPATVAAAGGGLPVGGDTGDGLEKIDSTDGNAQWVSFNYAGNGRFGPWSSSGLKDTVDKLVGIAYSPPTISLSASGGSGTVREKGAVVAGTTLSANIVVVSDPIAQVRFYLSPSTLLDTQSSGGAIPSGGTSTYNYTPNFSDTTSFYARVDDTGVTGGPSTVTSNTVTFTFVYPYYFGAGAPGLNAAAVAALTKDIRISTSSLPKSFSPTVGQVYYFAYPSSYGALTQIYDQTNFPTIGDWTRTTRTITGLDGTGQSYYVYEFNNVIGVAGTYSYTFVR